MHAAAHNRVSTRQGEYCILDIALPGRAAESAGVLLLDGEADELHLLLRRDWRCIAPPEDAEVLEALQEDLEWKARELGGRRFLEFLEDSLSNVLRIGERSTVLVDDFPRALRRLYRRHVTSTVQEFRTHLPVYSLRAAAGKWGDGMDVEMEGFEEVLDDRPLSGDMFIAYVHGRSMEPKIPDGSRCVFRGGGAKGSRVGRDFLIEHFGLSENEGRYTVKRYFSEKRVTEEGWEHTRITLAPLNPEYPRWELGPGDFRVLAEFVCVLD
jgi:hypothetical protein